VGEISSTTWDFATNILTHVIYVAIVLIIVSMCYAYS